MKSSLKIFYFWLWLLSTLVFIYYEYNFGSAFQFKKTIKPLKKGVRFHGRLMSYDRFMAMNYRFIDLGKAENPQYGEYTKFCSLNRKILGPRTVNKTKLDMKWVEDQLPMVRPGGFYAPKKCRSRHKVAIIVPYRDRYDNLVRFLYYMHPLWQKQYLRYRLFVVEQYGKYKFNKGALFNIAYIETQRFGSWDCLVFHDVDLIPLDERVLYTCPRKPTHMSPAIDVNNFTLQYSTLFGGVTAMLPRHYLATNGYSNLYWNWGAEDDDMFQRLIGARLSMSRLNSSIARFTALPHTPQLENPDRYRKLGRAKMRYKSEGLRTLQYRLITINKKKLYTHIVADVNPFNQRF